jgi:four helix bundle protein
MNNVWDNNLILIKSNQLVHLIYKLTRTFPKSELFGVTSQIRRASLSVVLNMIEGYSRFKPKSHIQFLEISFGSLKETHYLLEFCFQEKLINGQDFHLGNSLCDEIEKMLYAKIKTLKAKS